MNAANRARAGAAFDELAPHLGKFVRSHLRHHAPGIAAPERDDPSLLIRVILDNWQGVFSNSLRRAVKPCLHKLRDVRNRWAHWEQFTDEELRRALDTMRLVGEAIEAPPNELTSVRVGCRYGLVGWVDRPQR